MPFDQTNFVEAKPDVFSLEAFIQWLESKPADKVYCWSDPKSCLYCHYGVEHGLGNSEKSPYGAAIDGFKKYHGDSTEGEPFNRLAAKEPHTYGAALQRALELQNAL